MIVEIKGDYWEEAMGDSPTYDALVCTTNKIVKKNGCLVMGAGIARQFRDTFIGIDKEWGSRLNDNRHINGFMVTTKHISFGGLRTISLVSFPTKYHWKDKSSIHLIRSSFLTLLDTIRIMGWENILMTPPGCGLGGLEWPKVKSQLEQQLHNKSILSRFRLAVISK